MFFLIRSAVCIGLVVAALPGSGREGLVKDTLAQAAAGSAPVVEQAATLLCDAADGGCVPLLIGGVKAGLTHLRSPRAQARPSRDTLSEADRMPAWAGPAITAID